MPEENTTAVGISLNHSSTLSAFLREARWASGLSEGQWHRVLQEVTARSFKTGSTLQAAGVPASHWIGIIEGTVKVGVFAASGRCTTLVCASKNSWLGEPCLLNGTPCPHEVLALRDCRIAMIPRTTFLWLLESNLKFSRFVIEQLNARLGQQAQLLMGHRMHGVEARVAWSLIEQLDPQLHPKSSTAIQISQEEIGRLSGSSRQNTNRILHEFERARLVRLTYATVVVHDLEGLRSFATSH